MNIDELKNSLNEVCTQEQNSQIEYEINLEYSQISEADQQILQETHFSKDDLQDPETIKKLEDKLKKKEPIFIRFISCIICSKQINH
jgi:transcriptional regulator with AAA-type ATPase domain